MVVELLLSLKLDMQPYWFHHVGARLISRGVLSLPGASFWQPQSLVHAIFTHTSPQSHITVVLQLLQ